MINKNKILKEFKSIVAWKETENYELTKEITESPLTINHIYKIDKYQAGDNFANVANVIEGAINTNGCIFQAIGTTPLVFSNESILIDITFIYNFSDYYVNDIPGVDLVSIEKMLKLNETLISYETIYEYFCRIYDVEILRAIDEFLFYFNNRFKRTNTTTSKDFGKFSSQSEILSNNFYGILIDPQNSIYNVNRIFLKSTKSQTLRLYLYDVLSTIPLEYVDIELEANKASIASVDWLIQERNSENISTNYILGFFLRTEENPDEKKLDPENELYPVFCSTPEISAIYLNNELSLEDLNYIENSFFNISYNYDCDYTDILIENKLILANYIAYKIALRVIEDALSSKEFNNITESNRKVWQNMILNFRNIIYGYNFENEKGTGRQPGLLEELFIAFQGKNENLFPKIKKMTI